MNTIDLILLIGFALIGLAIIIYLVITKQWAVLRETAYRLMLRAEKVLDTAEGHEKMALVYTELYSLVPVWLRIFVTREDLETRLQRWYDAAKDWLDDGAINGSTPARPQGGDPT
jgi:hypothetical protein